MYVIHDYRDGKREPVVLARFEIRDGKAAFDESVGDPELLAYLRSGEFRDVSPDDGERFLEACKDAFCGGPFVNDEELFRRTGALWQYCREGADVPAAS